MIFLQDFCNISLLLSKFLPEQCVSCKTLTLKRTMHYLAGFCKVSCTNPARNLFFSTRLYLLERKTQIWVWSRCGFILLLRNIEFRPRTELFFPTFFFDQYIENYRFCRFRRACCFRLLLFLVPCVLF